MNTAVGPDARTSAAAFRAGISRATELDYFVALDDEDTDVGPLAGHVAMRNAIHSEGLGKMVGLGAGTLRSALASSNWRVSSDRTGFYLAVPDYSLRETALPESQNEDGAPRGIRLAGETREHLLERLLRTAGAEVKPAVSAVFLGDNCAFVRALDAAMTDLSAGKVDRSFVGGIDSFLDVPSLAWGMLHRRIKCDSNPVGFAPGEAAVFLELTSPEAAAAGARGYVCRPGFGKESGQRPDSEAALPAGVGLTLAIRDAIRQAQRECGVAITDLNGEVDRASDWGSALVRLGEEFPGLRQIPVWTPVAAFGETGCASAGLSIGVAVEALDRAYAHTDSILIVSSSATNDRGAVIVSRAP